MATLTSILSSDYISSSVGTLNGNYNSLNVAKVESSTLSGSYSTSSTISGTFATSSTVSATFAPLANPIFTGTVIASVVSTSILAGNVSLPQQSSARAYQSSVAQSVLASTFTTVVFDTKSWDIQNEFASNSFTAKTAGKYSVQSQVYLSGIASAKRVTISINVNGGAVTRNDNFTTTSAGGDMVTFVSDIVGLNVNDVVTVTIFQTDTGTRSLNNSPLSTYIAIDKLS